MNGGITAFLWLASRVSILGVAEDHFAGGVASGGLPRGMQRFEKCNERCGLRRTQIFPIGRHVAAALDHLADELVLRQSNLDGIERWASLPTQIPREWQLRHRLTWKTSAPCL